MKNVLDEKLSLKKALEQPVKASVDFLAKQFTEDPVFDRPFRLKKIGKIIESFFKLSEVKEILKDNLVEPVDMYGGQGKVGGKSTFDFSECGHEGYNQIVVAIALLTEKRKEYEAEMKIIPEQTMTKGKAKGGKKKMKYELPKLSWEEGSSMVKRPIAERLEWPEFKFK